MVWRAWWTVSLKRAQILLRTWLTRLLRNGAVEERHVLLHSLVPIKNHEGLARSLVDDVQKNCTRETRRTL